MPTASIILDRLICVQKAYPLGTDEPYLWNIFFKLDGSTVSGMPGPNFQGTPVVVAAPGEHGNLGTSGVRTGDIVRVPPTVGRWTTPVSTIPSNAGPIPPMVGVLSVLLEQDLCSNTGVQAGLLALRNLFATQLGAMISTKVVPSFPRPGFHEADIEGSLANARTEVVRAIINAQSPWENLRTMLNPDDVIGYEVWAFNLFDLATEFDRTIDFSTKFHRGGRRGEYKVIGRVEYTP